MKRRLRHIQLVLVAFVAIAAVVVVRGPSDVAQAASAKVTICHRTHSTTNPYRRITVNQNAAQPGGHGGHDLPNGSTNPAVYDPTFTYVANNKYWADIIPGGDAEGTPFNGSASKAMNWTTAGKADFFGPSCARMTPTEFYNAEVAAQQLTVTQIIADLNDQDANEDIALLAAIGGTFTADNVSSWQTAVSVTTLAATLETQTSATLNGTLTVGSTTTVTSFQYGISPTLTSSTAVAATPSSVTNTTAVSAALSALSAGTTYYFRAVGTTNAGLDTEGILYGEILSFQTAPATTTSTTAATTTTAAATTTTAAATTTTAAATTTTAAATTTTAAATTTTAAATTTTAPATTTTTPAATATTAPVTQPPATQPPASSEPTTTTAATTDDGIGTVRGLVWFDRNRDGTFNSSEWVLPGVTVTLSGAPLGSNSFGRAASAGTRSRTAQTAADGSYQFDQLVPGTYTVTATTSINGFDYTSDSDGSADWVVGVEAVANASVVADFAGLGRGEVVGQVFETTTLVGLPYASISCHWSGFDDIVGTDDDVTFTATADATGAFDLAGVPYGYFTCDGQDPLSGRASAPAAAAVFSATAVQAPLPVEAAAPLRTVVEPPGGLPSTGSDSSTAITLGCLLTLAGIVLVVGTRRPRRAR